MRKLFVLFLIVVFCSACNKTMIADSNTSLTTETVSSSESTSSNMDFTTPERWSEIKESKIHSMVELYPDVEIILQEKDTVPVDSISVNGAYTLPVITNETPLEDLIPVLKGGMYVVGAETMNTYASEQLFPYKNFHISHILEEKKIPVTFLRKMRDGYYYSVSKVENGGYAYFFFDRTLDLTSMEYVTDDMTDVYLVGCLYVEQLHKSSDFSAIKTGDSLEEVLKIDHSAITLKQWNKWSQETTGKTMHRGITNHLLEDGLITIQYANQGGELVVVNKIYSEDYKFKSPFFATSYERDYNIFPQDYPPET